VSSEDAGGIGAGSFFLGVMFGVAATLGVQWGDRNRKFDTAKDWARKKMNRDAAAPPSIKEARKAESLGLVEVQSIAPVPPQKPPGAPPSAPLPEGWTEELDPTSGRKYFYNAKTGESVWVRPK